MVELGNIITLENGFNFLVLEETYIDNVRYVYAVLTEKDDRLTDKFIILEVINKDDQEYVQEVENQELFNKLYETFKDGLYHE